MIKKPSKKLKDPTQYEKDLDFAFKNFGIWIFTQYNIMYVFWVLELGGLISKFLQYISIGDSKWGHVQYSLLRNGWNVSDKNPSLSFIGAYCIAVALSHPKSIIYILSKIKIFDFNIKHNLLNPQTLTYCFFISFFANELVNLILETVIIIFDMHPISLLII